MADTDKKEHLRRIAKILENAVVEGDEFQVTFHEGEIEVTESRSHQFQERYPRVYGRLLSLNEQMVGGCMVTVVGFVIAGIFCFGINVGWFDEILGQQVSEKLNSWWFFVVLFALSFAVTTYYYDWLEKRSFRRGRDDLYALFQDEGLDRDTILVQIKGDADLSNVFKQLKLDPGSHRVTE